MSDLLLGFMQLAPLVGRTRTLTLFLAPLNVNGDFSVLLYQIEVEEEKKKKAQK